MAVEWKFPLSMGQAVLLGVQLVAIVLAYGAIKSDIRDVGTRVEQHEHQIAELRVDRDRDRATLQEINADVKVLLERTKPRQ